MVIVVLLIYALAIPVGFRVQGTNLTCTLLTSFQLDAVLL